MNEKELFAYWWRRARIARDSHDELHIALWEWHEIARLATGSGYPVAEIRYIDGECVRTAFGVLCHIRQSRPWPEREDMR